VFQKVFALRRLCFCAALAATMVGSIESFADAVADFYAGKTVRILIGVSPGGAQDVQIRLLGKYLGNYIPGKPKIIAENMPGGGQRVAIEYLFNRAPQDGTYIGQVSPNLPAWQAIEGDLRADARAFQWIGSPGPLVGIVGAWHTTGVTTIEGARLKEMNFGSSGAGTLPDVVLRVMNEVVGTKFRLVRGYPGAAEQDIALERGELDGRYQTYANLKGLRSDWITDKKMNIFVQMGATSKDLSQVPQLTDLLKSADDKALVDLLVNSSHVLGRPYATGPGVPVERVNALRKAFESVLSDPGFLKEAAGLNMETDLMPGTEVAKTMDRVLASPPRTIERAKALLKE
jgi:tripartite-type tricarboxylate transporter receptor subunit TctC